jgi:hypothetical protein
MALSGRSAAFCVDTSLAGQVIQYAGDILTRWIDHQDGARRLRTLQPTRLGQMTWLQYYVLATYLSITDYVDLD